MTKFTKTLAAVAVLGGLTSGAAVAQNADAETQIVAVLDRYEAALNSSNAAAVVELYTADGVFMPPNVPAQIGTDALLAAYGGFFQMISFNLDFTVVEIIVASEDWAFVRTHSDGTGTLAANGVTIPQANQELFVFERNDSGEWKIARYAFNSTLAAN